MSEGHFSVDVRKDGDGLVMVLSGELDLASAPILRARIDDLAPGPGRVVLDLCGLEFMDSTGVACLFKLYRVVDDAGGKVVASGVQPMVRRVLELTQIDGVIEVLDTT